jgi:hypothetical protein
VPNPKDLLERLLHDAVCAHTVTLAAAQQAIAADWMSATQRLGLSGRRLAGAPAAAKTMSAIA